MPAPSCLPLFSSAQPSLQRPLLVSSLSTMFSHLLRKHLRIEGEKSLKMFVFLKYSSEYNQEIPQSQTTDKPIAREKEPHDNHETPGRQTKQSNNLYLLPSR